MAGVRWKADPRLESGVGHEVVVGVVGPDQLEEVSRSARRQD